MVEKVLWNRNSFTNMHIASCCIKPNWHELRKQEKYSSLAPPRSTFYKTQWAWHGVKLTWLMLIFTSKKVWKFLIKHQLTKSDPKRTRWWKVPCLIPIRVKPVQQSRQRVLRTYCPNINTMPWMISLWSHNLDLMLIFLIFPWTIQLSLFPWFKGPISPWFPYNLPVIGCQTTTAPGNFQRFSFIEKQLQL